MGLIPQGPSEKNWSVCPELSAQGKKKEEYISSPPLILISQEISPGCVTSLTSPSFTGMTARWFLPGDPCQKLET